MVLPDNTHHGYAFIASVAGPRRSFTNSAYSARKAAAIILDGLVPRPVSGMLPANYFHVSANGPDGAWFRVEYSTDLLNWSSICTNQVINGGIDFVDPDVSTDQSRLYRTVPESGPPAQ